MLMLIAHVGKYWLRTESQWLVALFYILVNMNGTNGFTFVAGLGFGFSRKHSQARGELRQQWFRRSLIRTLLLLCVSVGFNVVAAFVRGGSLWWEYIWYWNILQCIAIARLIGQLLTRWPLSVRIIFAIIVLAITPFIAGWIHAQSPFISLEGGLAAWIFYVFFNPMYADGILFFLPFFLIGSALGETLFSVKIICENDNEIKNKEEKEINSINVNRNKNENAIRLKSKHRRRANSPQIWIWIVGGVCLVGSSLILGKDLSMLDFGWGLLDTINLHPELTWVGLPLYLVPNSWVWVMFSLGFEILLTLGIVFLTDFIKLKTKQVKERAVQRKLGPFEIFGRYSLSIYLTHYIGLFSVPWQHSLDHRTIWAPLIGFLGVIWSLLYGLHHLGNGRYSLEYLMQKGIRQFLQSRNGEVNNEQ